MKKYRWISLLWIGLLLGLPCLGDGLIEAFQYADAATARSAWQAKAKSPPVTLSQQGIQLTIPFEQDLDRVYWQLEKSMDLSSFTSFQLDLSCPAPEALRSLAVYFKSGPGWYIWNQPIPGSGRRTLHLPRAGFETEGRPTGWHRIEAIRISPWKAASLNTTLSLHRFTAHRDSVLVIQGTLSVEGDAEKRAATGVARRISRWMAEAGVPHNLLTDEELALQSLDGIRLIVLSYHHILPDKLRSRLLQYLQRGGKLMVFFSRDEQLARAMGFRIGPVQRSDIPGTWSRIDFSEDSPLSMPQHVFQESWNVRPAYPDRKDASVLASWGDAAGRTRPEPAWVQSPQGFWMSHILLGGDQENKKRMLLGMAANCDPSLWPEAARLHLQQAVTLEDSQTMTQTLTRIAAAEKHAQHPKQLHRLLEGARRSYNQAVEDFNAGSYGSSVKMAIQAEHLLSLAYGAIQPGRKNEIRAVWDHRGVGIYPGNWNRTAKELRSFGITDLYANLQWGGTAHYPSRVLPPSDTHRLLGDQAKAFEQACRKNNLRSHSWIVLWKLENAPETFVQSMKEQGRLQVDVEGNILPWLNPAHPENQALMLDAIEEILTAYPLDGIHLDYVRYPSPESSFDAYSRKQFENRIGRKVQHWPDDVVLGGALAGVYQQFRQDQISRFVQSVRAMMKRVRPEAVLSAAVFGKYPSCAASVGQDWKRWLDHGWLDFVCPMNYTPSNAAFREWVRDQTQNHASPGQIIAGIGVTAAESDLSPRNLIEQIRIAREYNCAGIALFDLDPALLQEQLPILSNGLFRN